MDPPPDPTEISNGDENIDSITNERRQSFSEKSDNSQTAAEYEPLFHLSTLPSNFML
jgi:hypothetical protein